MSGCSATNRLTSSSCAATAYPLYPPSFAGLTLPVSRSSRRKRTTELRLTPYRSAASSKVAPCSISLTTRARKSSEYGFGMHAGLLPSEKLESYSLHHGNPHRFNLFGKRSSVRGRNSAFRSLPASYRRLEAVSRRAARERLQEDRAASQQFLCPC